MGYALALVWLTVVADALRLSPLLAALSFGVLLLKQLLDEGFVLCGGLQLGLQFQRLFPGIDGRFQLAIHG